MGVFLVCLSLFVACALAQTGDTCLDSSIGKQYVGNLYSSGGLQNINGALTNQQGISYLWNIVSTVTTPYYLALYFGLSNGQFFAIKQCQSVDAIPYAKYCGYDPTNNNANYSPYIAYIKGVDPSDTQQRTIWALNGQGQLGAQLGTESSAYPMHQRAWYVQAMAAGVGVGGWTGLIAAFSSGTNTHTYYKQFSTQGAGLTGVMAWDRVYREPCDSCTMNSQSIPKVQLVVSQDLSSSCIGAVSWGGIVRCWNVLLTAWKATNRGRNSGYGIGLANNDYYELDNCAIPEYAAACNATLAGQTTDFVMWVVNYAVYGDNLPHYFGMNLDGTVFPNELVALRNAVSPSAFYPTQRPWYQIANGFTDVFCRIGTNGFCSKSFVQALYSPGTAYNNPTNVTVAGVVSASISTLEPCLGFAPPPCTTPCTP